MTIAPVLNYFPFAARGELSRFVCVAAEVDMIDFFPGLGFKKKVGWFGAMPQVTHGTFSLCQSSATAKYFAALSQKWQILTPQQVAVDNMFAAYSEDLLDNLMKGDAPAQKSALDKIFGALEQLVPQAGFINGQDFPTTADMTLVLVAYGFLPFQYKIRKLTGYNWQEKFPKIKANVDRSVAVPEVQRYVHESKSLQAGFLNILGSIVGSSIGCGGTVPESLQEVPSTGPARAPSSISTEEVLQLVYFPVAGRGELCRLLAAVGGVPLEDLPPPADESHKNEFTGSLPQMKHGDFKLTQSGAIESYIAAIAPKFQGLTSQQRAIDDCYAATKEDIIQAMVKVVFGQEKEKETALKKLPATLDKFLSVLEDKAPQQGFTHGLGFPTGADLALLNITSAGFPFQKSYKAANYDWQSKFPKIKALVERTQAAPGVQEYLASSKSFGAIPF
eukprot:CAMPEP_0194486442 /NCGR_PEP_ID=MMETSP0253-20130528/7089_1 /TAXON_ID=2966 /ORGANISM="Noctiluca scintillans" /LENGTH=446 /DNA_ID=CAMNT_0039326533 /DNA_START=14 /DNA_END=1354 /DNA_ORIENTATION=+